MNEDYDRNRPERPLVALAIPAFNEADGIAEFLNEVDACFRTADVTIVYIVVDDRSTDSTVDTLSKLRNDLSGRLVIFQSEKNRGHGPTVMTAYLRALEQHPTVVVQVDGDGQFGGEDVVQLAQLGIDDDDMFVGLRKGRSDPWYRTVLTAGLRLYLRVFFSVESPDPNSPLRAYPSAVLQHLIADIPLDAVIPNVYLTVLAHRMKRNPTYVPVIHRTRRGNDPRGTTWRSNRIVPVRLIRLVFKAAVESVPFRHKGQPVERGDGKH